MTASAASNRGDQGEPIMEKAAVTHRIAWTIEEGGGWPDAAVFCDGKPGDLCRSFCPRSSCEEGCIDPDNHERTPQKTCNIVDWLTSDGITDCYEGDRATVHDGPIRTWWDGDGIRWEYPSA